MKLLKEMRSKSPIVITFGRFNPPTIGHAKLIHKVLEVAHALRADHRIYTSLSRDTKKNPLSYQEKLKYLKAFFPEANVVEDYKVISIFSAIKKVADDGYRDVVMVVGSDRVPEIREAVAPYIKKETDKSYRPSKDIPLNSFRVVSAGERDPDAEGVEGMSASKMREAASKNEYAKFRNGVPNTKYAQALFKDVRKGMGLSEELVTEGVNDPGIFKAVFLAGGPGSGKDFVLRSALEGHGLVELSSDIAFEYLMKKSNFPMIMTQDRTVERDIIRGRAKTITTEKQRLIFAGRLGVIVNGTADELTKITNMKHQLDQLGYDSMMVFVYTTNEESKARNIARGMRGGRTVPENVRQEKWHGSIANLDNFQRVFGKNFIKFDNSINLFETDPATKKEKEAELTSIFKRVSKFVNTPPTTEIAKNWIHTQKQKLHEAMGSEVFTPAFFGGAGDYPADKSHLDRKKTFHEVSLGLGPESQGDKGFPVVVDRNKFEEMGTPTDKHQRDNIKVRINNLKNMKDDLPQNAVNRKASIDNSIKSQRRMLKQMHKNVTPLKTEEELKRLAELGDFGWDEVQKIYKKGLAEWIVRGEGKGTPEAYAMERVKKIIQENQQVGSSDPTYGPQSTGAATNVPHYGSYEKPSTHNVVEEEKATELFHVRVQSKGDPHGSYMSKKDYSELLTQYKIPHTHDYSHYEGHHAFRIPKSHAKKATRILYHRHLREDIDSLFESEILQEDSYDEYKVLDHNYHHHKKKEHEYSVKNDHVTAAKHAKKAKSFLKKRDELLHRVRSDFKTEDYVGGDYDSRLSGSARSSGGLGGSYSIGTQEEKKTKAVVSVTRPIGHKIADIGPGGKEYNVVKSKDWKEPKKFGSFREEIKTKGSSKHEDYNDNVAADGGNDEGPPVTDYTKQDNKKTVGNTSVSEKKDH